MTDRVPAPPRGTKAEGRRLWKSVLGEFTLDEHELSLLRQACRVADMCSDLQAIVDADGPISSTPSGPRTHPAVVELRQQRILLARLVVALRVPLGEETERSSQGTPRLQRRAVRGVYGLRGAS
jgi:hypothetical protein